MIIHDSENDERIFKDNISRDILHAYQKALNYIRDRIEKYCISREADYIQAITTDSLQDILLGAMTQRGIIQ